MLMLIYLNVSLSHYTDSNTTQDVGNDTYDICDTSVLKKKVIVTYGQSVHLGCFVKIPEVLKNQQVKWYHHSKEKGR